MANSLKVFTQTYVMRRTQPIWCTMELIEAIRSHFGKDWKLSGAVSLGYPDGEPPSIRRKTVDQVAEFQG